jgi:Zn finger protein HypA/HybF involved in hydrogenase expression
MGMYNLLKCDLKCPRCGHEGEVKVETKVGFLDLSEHRLGDAVTWAPGHSVPRGARPEAGNLDGEGYAECPSCHRDYFVIVEVRDDRISAVRVDPSRPGHIP